MKISHQTFSAERALYGARELTLDACRFEGEEDGESALKESAHVTVKNSLFSLRYPLWHTTDTTLCNCTFTESSRAPIWYAEDVRLLSTTLHAPKAVREVNGISLTDCTVKSDEFGWFSKDVSLSSTRLSGEYALFHSRALTADRLTFKGKYAFQYLDGGRITNATLDTKDAFWHSRGVTVEDSTLRGEYLGWYAEDLTLVRCTVIGTQPLCYCKNLTLIDCEMEDCDLAFEKSTLSVSLRGGVTSIKAPAGGKIVLGAPSPVLAQNDGTLGECEILVL